MRALRAVTEPPFAHMGDLTMIATTTTGSLLFPHTPLCPSPLHIQKKPRKTTFRSRIFRKSTHSSIGDRYAFGPLDDIIDEIKSDIYELPPNDEIHVSFFDWVHPLKTPRSRTAALPSISRTPSDHPLTIPKNRNRRSTASGSSLEASMTHPSDTGQEDRDDKAPKYSSKSVPWPLPDMPLAEPAYAPGLPVLTTSPERVSTQQASEGGPHIHQEHNKPSRPRKSSKLKLLANSLPLLRRQGTGETNVSTGHTLDPLSPTATATPEAGDEAERNSTTEEVNEEAVVAYLARNARDGEKFKGIMKQLTKHLPPPTDNDRESASACKPDSLPTTPRAAVSLFSDVKVLTRDIEEVTVTIDIDGVLHNRRSLPDATIDVVFVVNNSYYVTDACLERSLEAVNGALCHLGSGDRLALYTTHCTHRKVTGNRPEILYPLRHFSRDTEAIFRELTSTIAHTGTQAWDPPRPNPSMTDVILGIARSLEVERLKAGRTHIIILSPAAHILHHVSKYFPDLQLHRTNPAILPCRREPEFQDTICTEDCCINVFASNWSKYQSTPSRIKRILQNARCTNPVGELTALDVDIRSKAGCEVVEFYGNRVIPQLYLGQVHTLFVKVRVTKAEARSINLDSEKPILHANLDASGLRQELLNAIHVGATKLHLLDIQVLYRNSLHDAKTWNYTECPVIAVSELGGLTPPQDASMEVYKRQYFHKLAQLSTDEARAVAENILRALPQTGGRAKELVERMIHEIDHHRVIREYEKQYRQKLPLCPGPIEVEAPHQWLIELWNRKKHRCDCPDAS